MTDRPCDTGDCYYDAHGLVCPQGCWSKRWCNNRCCTEHPDRRCVLDKGHDGNHDGGEGHQWLNERMSDGC